MRFIFFLSSQLTIASISGAAPTLYLSLVYSSHPSRTNTILFTSLFNRVSRFVCVKKVESCIIFWDIVSVSVFMFIISLNSKANISTGTVSLLVRVLYKEAIFSNVVPLS
ncbi:unnamed protein product [Meganyctiphanes norvegica]|uniref:Secreted protein n=1 Tax=Meganyctiphanes norvegica TaxID=48144 RepID=A0AAV2PRJ0_MEGNR